MPDRRESDAHGCHIAGPCGTAPSELVPGVCCRSAPQFKETGMNGAAGVRHGGACGEPGAGQAVPGRSGGSLFGGGRTRGVGVGGHRTASGGHRAGASRAEGACAARTCGICGRSTSPGPALRQFSNRLLENWQEESRAESGADRGRTGAAWRTTARMFVNKQVTSYSAVACRRRAGKLSDISQIITFR